MTTVVLTIAGSDPSGGAGIQADLRTFTALGIVGVSAITALTVQNSLGVQSVHPVPADVLTAQLEAIFSDIKVDAVKIGMLGGADQVRAVAAVLRKYQPPNIVLDPVLASTGGVPLLDEEGRQALLTELMPLCDLITPNLSEAAALTGLAVDTDKAMEAAGSRLLEMGARAVLVKGGHLPGKPTDVLLTKDDKHSPYEFSDERVDTEHTHGTGCLLSSGIAGYMALGRGLESSVYEAKQRLAEALGAPMVVGNGRGYPNILAVKEGRAHALHEWRLSKIRGLYVITDPELQQNRQYVEVVRAAFAGGASTVQFRDKKAPLQSFVTQASWLEQLAQANQAVFIVNDRVDAALASGADGVHLGPDDMKPADARRLMGPDKLVGVSVATVEEAKAAAPYVSYFGVENRQREQVATVADLSGPVSSPNTSTWEIIVNLVSNAFVKAILPGFQREFTAANGGK